MNIGPMGDGEIDPKDASILAGIGEWWKVNGDSIRGTTRTPLAVQTWGQSTRKGNRLYLHVYQWPSNGKLVIGGLKSDVASVRVLGDPSRAKLTARRVGPLDIMIENLPTQAPNAIDSVIEVSSRGDIATDPTRVLQAGYPLETLHVFDASLVNQSNAPQVTATSIDDKGRVLNQPTDRLRFGSGSDRDDFVQGWVNTAQAVVWHVRVTQPMTYSVSLDYVANKESDGGQYAVRFGDRELDGTVHTSPGSIWQARSQVDALGDVTLEPGEYDIAINAVKINGKELFNPRKLMLTPKN
jgi:hypothetical protein